jgi:AraC-like DNA-binding protein
MHLLLYLKGSPKVSWRNGKRSFQRKWKYGDYTFVGKDLEICDVSVDGDHEGLAIGMPSEEMEVWMQSFSFAKYPPLGSLPLHLYGEDPQLLNMALAIKDEIGRGCPCGKIFAESISLALLTYFYGNHCTEQSYRPRQSRGFPPARLRLVEEYIGANLGSNISLVELAALAHVSPSRFSRIFSMATGMPPHRYVMHARIDRAKKILRSPYRSVTEVALELGFASPSHFSFAFRKITGTSPKEFAQLL